MDDAAAASIAEASFNQWQQPRAPPELAPSLPPMSSMTDSGRSDTKDVMPAVPEDSEEVWSDAQEAVETDERTGAAERDTEETDGAFDGSANVRGAVSGLEPALEEVKIVTEDNRGAPEIVTVEEPPPSLTTSVDSPERAEVATAGPPSLYVSSAPVSPTATASVHAGASLEVPSSSMSSRAVSPSPTQSSQGLERRQSRRRSTVDNRATNRFSSLLSSLIHRRPDRDNPSTSSTRPSVREEGDLSHSKGDESSRTSSPSRPVRSVTPPPSLAPPSLQELGLSLSAITSILTPSHFSTPPSSGTFLKPHYLLLCHTQGLDVLPLVSPPAPQPYALVRRVSFKNVVVMEEKGVLVAIAGRRDGVRVYALEEVKKAVEWRVDVEIRREKDRLKREEAKRGTAGGVDKVFGDLKPSASLSEKTSKSGLTGSPTTPTPSTLRSKRRKSSVGTTVSAGSVPPRPRAPTVGRKSRKTSVKEVQPTQQSCDPPPYQSPATTRPDLQGQSSVISVTQTRSRSGSVQNVLAGNSVRRRSVVSTPRDAEKGDWEHHSSDDEAINMASAGPSGSAALDERTSSMPVGSNSAGHTALTQDGSQLPTSLDIPSLAESRRHSQTSSSPTPTRRGRPAQLDLTLSRTPTATGNAPRPPPSPTPSVWTLRQALTAVPPVESESRSTISDMDGEDDDDEGNAEPISFAQALMESRLPNLPPPGSRQPQEPIIISAQYPTEPQSPRETVSEAHTEGATNSSRISQRSRRRWSVLDGVFSQSASNDLMRSSSQSNASSPRPRTAGESIDSRPTSTLARINSAEATQSLRQDSSRGHPSISSLPPRPSTSASMPAAPSPSPSAVSMPSHHRFLPRIITNAFLSRRSEDQPSPGRKSFAESAKSGNAAASLPPAPKLEYVKLPGTKGAIMIKAVETAKKSFLAILCGENGEKVELFAGTYRTTLGLSRTFILPDSPRSLELQLQGDDLVEVFLVFAQNVFGLEPATVRVREVRVGRAERRAARRRARENRAEELVSTDANAPSLGDGDATDASVSVGVTLSTSTTSQTFDEAIQTPPPMSRQVSETNLNGSESTQQMPVSTAQTEELAALATAHVAPYTTFQQLSFAPQFPLATIADECVIPPTYQSFLEYRAQYEPEPGGANNLDLANVQFSPPGLPIPPTLPPSKWYYRDPKGVVQGPWKASLMQTWYKDGLLPPDLPVRREEDQEYILLKDLRAQSVDPAHPFRPPPPPLKSFCLPSEPTKPLLDPISLLTQHRRYGPPALFFTSRGGHSTTVVDARGRSVLRGRLHWSIDEEEDFSVYGNKLGDVKRLEAFDIGKTTVIAAIRQGGLEVTDVADALMHPGDLSRSVLPNFRPHASAVSRRGPFVWRVGSSLSAFATGPVSSDKSLPVISSSKKQGLAVGKSTGKGESGLGNADDYEGRQHEELLFLGRLDETVYFCERSNGSFRILRLCPNST